MQSDPSSAWPSAAATATDDLANFFEFNDIDLDFQAFEDQTSAQTSQDVSAQNGAKQGYDTTEYYDQMRHASIPKTGSTGDLRGRMTGLQMRTNNHPMQHGYPQSIQYQSRIPPTPSSSELHGTHPHLLVDSQQAAMYEAHMRKQQEQVGFLVIWSANC